MSNSFHVLLMGGDARYIEMVNTLSKKEIYTTLVGWEKITFPSKKVTKQTLNQIDFSTFDAIMLPVSGTNEHGEIELAPYTTEKLVLTKDMLQKTKESCVIYTGVSTPSLDKLTSSTNKKLVCLFQRDDLAILNSIPTAEGTLQIAMEQMDVTVHSSSVLVLGFGRVGLTVARVFRAVGGDVTVGIRSSTNAARVHEMGMNSLFTEELQQNVGAFQLIINTIPHLILDSPVISNMNEETVIIDLASKPGGTDFSYAKKKEITAIHALGIPGNVAPKTAGKVIADVFLDQLKLNDSK